MGSIIDKNVLRVLEENIARANSITQTDLFFYKEGVYIDFNIIPKTFSTKVLSHFYYVEEKNRKNLKERELDLNEFYTFYNCLMDSKNIFLGEKIKSNIIKRKSGEIKEKEEENENEYCPICNENKVEVMLDCSHFFCQKCIKTWLFDKKNTCPLCRFKVDLKNVRLKEKDQWDLIDINEVENYEIESERRLQSIIKKYLTE